MSEGPFSSVAACIFSGPSSGWYFAGFLKEMLEIFVWDNTYSLLLFHIENIIYR